MELNKFIHIAIELMDGYSGEIEWQENLQPCDNSHDFFREACWVILNSGMKEQIARKIWDRIRIAWSQDIDISTVFNHKGKVAAIKYLAESHARLFSEYAESENKIEYLETIPFIGKITKYHLAKNLGFDCVKPDRHLVRLANQYGTTPNELCETLSKQSGYKKCTVDIILWRAANLGMI